VDTWTHRRRLLALERAWASGFDVSHLPAVRAADLVRGCSYVVLTRHSRGCWLPRGGKCSCRPISRFYVAEAGRS
jgi:hypothetical protein